MIINDGDQSAITELTNRTFLLDKTLPEYHQQPQIDKKELFTIIKDKTIIDTGPQNQDVQRRIYRFYRKFTPIRPENPLIVIWNVIVMLVIIIYLLEFPLILGYGQIVWKDISTDLLPLMVVFYFILMTDIFLTPLKMQYREGLLIKDTRILVKEYLRRNFWIDIVGLLTLLIPMIFRKYYAVNLLKIFFLPKVLILNRLDRKVISVLVFQVKMKTFYSIARLIVFMILISHYIGIGFYIVAYYIYSTNYYGPNTPNITWIYNAEAYSQIVLLLDWKGQYAYTMYFSLGMTTTIAYGDITPLNPIETTYIIFALVINTIAFGYILSEILRILIEGFYAQFDKNNTNFTMQNLLVTRKIKPQLKQSIRAHMQQISKQEMYRDRKMQRQIISSLPFNLQISLSGQIYQEFIEKLNISPDPFSTDKNKNSRFIQKILLEITQTRYLSGDLIYKQNETHVEEFNNHKTYFIKQKSQIDEIIFGVGKNPSINLQNHRIQNQNDFMLFYNDRIYFGEAEFFTGNPRSHWVMSKNNILLYELSRNSFLRNLKFANMKELQHLTQLKETITDSYCYICFEGHNFKKCQKTKFIPNITEAIKRIEEKQKMTRRHNSKIENVRTQKRNQSAKTNALKVYKNYLNLKDKKALQRSKIRLLASSKHYRRVYYEEQHEIEENRDDTSSGSSQDLDYFIQQTRALIQNLGKVGHNEDYDNELQFFEYQFDKYCHFKGYKPSQNFENVIENYSQAQKLSKSIKSRTKLYSNLLN